MLNLSTKRFLEEICIIQTEIKYNCLIVVTPHQNIKHLTGVEIQKLKILVLLRVDDVFESYSFLRSWIEINVYKILSHFFVHLRKYFK